MAIDEQLIDEILKDYKSPEDIIGEDGLLKQLTKALVERAMSAELTHHLGYEKNEVKGKNSGNSRNGKYSKKLKGNFGEVDITVPRDRNGEFEPQIVQKGQSRFTGFDDKILSMYSLGMTTRDIQSHLNEIYGVNVSPDLISTVTDQVKEEIKLWQERPLDPMYLIVYLDAIFLKVRDEGHIINKAIYMAIGINTDGKKEVLGLWIEKTEGAKFWLKVITELNRRGVNDILIACVDGLKGFPEAIESIFPKTQVQGCIVHMVRNSLKYVSWKERKKLAADLKAVYSAIDLKSAEAELDKFESKWGEKYPSIGQLWRRNWDRVIPLFDYPENIRRVIYTTNAIESANNGIRKYTKNRGSFPNDESAVKLVYLALKQISKRWTMPIREWGPAFNQFSIIFGDRVTLEERS